MEDKREWKEYKEQIRSSGDVMSPSAVSKFFLARILAKILEMNKIGEEQLAKILFVSKQEVMDWLNRKNLPDTTILNRIAKEFGLLTEGILSSGIYGTEIAIYYVFRGEEENGRYR